MNKKTNINGAPGLRCTVPTTYGTVMYPIIKDAKPKKREIPRKKHQQAFGFTIIDTRQKFRLEINNKSTFTENPKRK